MRIILTIVNYFLYLVMIMFGLFIANGQALFGPNPQQNLVLTEVLIGAGIFLFASISLIVLNVFKKKYRPNLFLVVCFSILLIGLVISILVFQDQGTYQLTNLKYETLTVEYHISFELRITFIVEAALFVLTNFLVFDLTHQIFDLKQFITVVCFLALVTVLALSIISYVTEYEKYIAFTSEGFNENIFNIYAVSSVFPSKNNFAFILTIAIIALIYLHHFYKKWFILLFIIPLYANIFYTFCKALLLLDFLIISIYLSYHIIKKNCKKETNKIFVFVIVFSSFVILYGVSRMIFYKLTDNNDLLGYIFDDERYRTIVARSWIWSKSVHVTEFGNWLTGVGYNLFGELLYSFNIADSKTMPFNISRSAHNVALEWIGNGGLLMLFVGLTLLAYIIFLAFKNYKKNSSLIFLSLLLIAFSIPYSFIESGSFIFSRTIDYSALSLFIVVPIFHYNKRLHA